MTTNRDELELRRYDPNRLLDELRQILGSVNDAALGRELDLPKPLISKVRHRKTPVKAALLIHIHEACGLSITDLRFLLGDRRKKFRVEVPSR